MPFSDLLGNPNAKASLTKMLASKRIPQVLLFSGIKGIGKFQFAKQMAAQLLGNETRVLKESHPDLHVYLPEGKARLHSMASMQKLIEEGQMPPFEAPCKVFIIDDVENMLTSSSNALLKTLEEPFADTYYILLTSNIKKVLPTIQSRTQKVTFFPIPEEEIIAFFEKQGNKSKETEEAARFSSGSMMIADLLLKEKTFKKQILELLTAKEYPKFLRLLQEREKDLEVLQDEDPELFEQKIDLLFAYILYWYRDRKLVQLDSPNQLFYADEKETFSKESSSVTWEKAFELIERAKLAVSQNLKCKTVLEELFFKLQIF